MFKRLAVIALLACASVAAIAVPKPSEVKAAVASGNYVKAESLLLEVMKEKPSARAHYDLGQVYTFQGKHNLALNEYRQAQIMDPSLKFASNAAEFTKKLETAQAMVAPPRSAAPVIYSIPAVQAATVTSTPPKSESGSVLPAILIILLIGGVAGGAFYVVTRKKEKKEVEDQITAARREKNSTLLGFSKQLEDATLIAKTASYNDAQKRQILDRIQSLQVQTRNMLAELKDGKEVSSVRLSTLESHVNTAVDQSTHGLPHHTPAPTPAPVHSIPGVETTINPVPVETTPPHSIPGVPTTPPPAPAPRPNVGYHYHNPAPASAPIVVSNNDGLLTGVVIGSLMNQHHHTERVVERVVERPRMDTPRYERDDYEDRAPAPAPTEAPSYDSGSSSTDDYASDPPAMDSSSSSSDDDKY